ncbi:hypothetical protein [Petroclostridium sp. X23]|uniref:hypothetical protein n=1 Tax=Petroclostridium sp. X23 TaxID=3045146 RepID=UPI0024ACD27A|nr:hypothetical protein [Petroclostridium sp. X23]WHH58645.1 hypothetical protein QKW49_23090 [Petroclostridium sp. X23]
MKKRLIIVTIIASTTGVILILLASYLEIFFPAKNAFYIGVFGDAILSIIKGLGIALITSALINALKYFAENAETLIRNDFISILKNEELRSIKSRIDHALYFRGRNYDEDNFYTFYEKEISSLLDSYYYKSYKTFIDCEFSTYYIKKTIRKQLEMINAGKKSCTTKIPFEASLQKVNGFDMNDLYQIKKFTIDSKDYTQEINEKLTICDNSNNSTDEYCINASTSYEVAFEHRCQIDMIIETIVPIDDTHFSNKVTVPCKEYSITFKLNNPLYKLSWYSFGFSGNHKDKLLYEIPLKDALEIGFKEWILPGDGVLIAINKKV